MISSWTHTREKSRWHPTHEVIYRYNHSFHFIVQRCTPASLYSASVGVPVWNGLWVLPCQLAFVDRQYAAVACSL